MSGGYTAVIPIRDDEYGTELQESPLPILDSPSSAPSQRSREEWLEEFSDANPELQPVPDAGVQGRKSSWWRDRRWLIAIAAGILLLSSFLLLKPTEEVGGFHAGTATQQSEAALEAALSQELAEAAAAEASHEEIVQIDDTQPGRLERESAVPAPRETPAAHQHAQPTQPQNPKLTEATSHQPKSETRPEVQQPNAQLPEVSIPKQTKATSEKPKPETHAEVPLPKERVPEASTSKPETRAELQQPKESTHKTGTKPKTVPIPISRSESAVTNGTDTPADSGLSNEVELTNAHLNATSFTVPATVASASATASTAAPLLSHSIVVTPDSDTLIPTNPKEHMASIDIVPATSESDERRRSAAMLDPTGEELANLEAAQAEGVAVPVVQGAANPHATTLNLTEPIVTDEGTVVTPAKVEDSNATTAAVKAEGKGTNATQTALAEIVEELTPTPAATNESESTAAELAGTEPAEEITEEVVTPLQEDESVPQPTENAQEMQVAGGNETEVPTPLSDSALHAARNASGEDILKHLPSLKTLAQEIAGNNSSGTVEARDEEELESLIQELADGGEQVSEKGAEASVAQPAAEDKKEGKIQPRQQLQHEQPSPVVAPKPFQPKRQEVEPAKSRK